MKTVTSGAATCLYTATAPELEGKGGSYQFNCQIAEVSEDILDSVRPYAVDPEAAKRLWTASEEMVGQNFNI